MKNLKKLLLVPVLALGTISSCYSKPDDTKCPEEKKCDTCPEVTPSNPSDSGSGVSKNGHTLSVDAKEIKVLVDEDIGKVKHIIATVSPTSDTISYTSSDTSVAEVSSSGVITGKKANAYCVITVKSSAGLQLEIAVKTYDVGTYFIFDSVNAGTIVTVIDQNVVDLELPAYNPTRNNSPAVTNISCFMSTVQRPLSKLERIVLPSSLTTVSNYAFAGNSPKCEYVYVGSGVTSISGGAFIGLNNLKTIEIEEGNATYATSTTENGSILYNLGLMRVIKGYNNPNGLLFDEELGIKIISYCAYANLDSLVDIRIPEGVESVRFAFIGNKNVKSLYIPSTVSLFGDNSAINRVTPALFGSPELERIEVSHENTTFYSVDSDGIERNAIFSTDSTNQSVNVHLGCKNSDISGSFTSDRLSVGRICNFAFYKSNLEGTFVLPNTVKILGIMSFAANPQMRGIYLPNSVTTLSDEVNPTLVEVVTAGSNSELANAIGDFYQYISYDDKGNFIPYLSKSLYNDGRFINTFYGCSNDFVIYYQTRNDNKSFIDTFGTKFAYNSNYNLPLYKTVEVQNSDLQPPVVPVEEDSGEGEGN